VYEDELRSTWPAQESGLQCDGSIPNEAGGVYSRADWLTGEQLASGGS
jgi:hypothetical protein